MDQFVNFAQIVFVDEFVLLGLGSVVDGLIKLFLKDVPSFELPGVGLFGDFLLLLLWLAIR